MAFYALVEHDTNVAPIWDQDRHMLVALMTVSDYIRALRLCNARNVSMLEFQQKSIAEVMDSKGVFQLEHPEFSSLDAEDSIQMMCHYFRNPTDYTDNVGDDPYLFWGFSACAADGRNTRYLKPSGMRKRGNSGVLTAPATAIPSDILGAGTRTISLPGRTHRQPFLY